MRALQRELALRMVELRLIELRDVGLAALVFGMAGATFADPRILHSTMETAAGAHILGDILVAVEAQRSLRHLVGPVMAVAAAVLLLDVRFADFTGHQQRLDCRSRRSGRT